MQWVSKATLYGISHATHPDCTKSNWVLDDIEVGGEVSLVEHPLKGEGDIAATTNRQSVLIYPGETHRKPITIYILLVTIITQALHNAFKPF